MAQIYGLILWYKSRDQGYGMVLIYLAIVKGESLRRMFNQND